MIAKPTLASAVIVTVLAGPAALALADPGPGGDTIDDPAPTAVEPDLVPTPTETPDPYDPPPVPPPVPAKHEQPTGRFTIGAGYSTDDKFVATAEIAQDNLFGTGLQLSMAALLSARRQLFLNRFVDPHLLGSDFAVTTDIYADQRELPGFTRKAAGGSVTVAHPLTEHLRGFVGYRLEHVEVGLHGDDAAAARAIDPSTPGRVPLGGGILSSVRAGLAYSNLDSVAWPRHGTSAGIVVEHADRRLGSDLELDRASAYLAHHEPLGPFTLHLGFSADAVTSAEPFGVPRSERLFLDGSSDIRGYAPGALGPATGGNLRFAGRGELEVPLWSSIGLSAAGFVDVGGVYDRSGDGGMGHAFGFGLRWHSPIGTLNFDWAFPADGGKPVFLFSLGSPF